MNMDAKRYYAILGVDPGSSDDEIRAAFRRRAKELHPDSESGSTGAFIHLKHAYDALSNPQRRAEYDRACWRVPRAAYPAAPPRLRRRSRGPGFGRYAAAFIFMGGISFGFIEAMISFAEVPPASSIHAMAPHPALARDVGSTAVAADDTSSSGKTRFGDASSPNGTSHETAEHSASTGSVGSAAGISIAPGRW